MTTETPLTGWRVAVPESRQLDVLNDMLAIRGASVTRCPLVSIHDSPNEAEIKQWLEGFCAGNYEDFIILTGEGIRRLTGFAERLGMAEAWSAALSQVRKIARGPKPGSALRPHKTKPDLLAAAPTTEGVIETLSQEDLKGHKVAVQLYGEEPNHKLQDFLHQKGADFETVAPYIYASDMDTEKVEALIHQMRNNELDVLVLTSIVQIKRLRSVAKKAQLEAQLLQALNNIHIASVGPVVADMLAEMNVPVAVMPDEKFFMKPLVRKLVEFVKDNPKS